MSKIDCAKSLLQWKYERLNKHADLNKEEIATFFAPKFALFANERHYDGNYNNYLDFLNQFRTNIERLRHEVYQYLVADNTVVMPMRASIEYDTGSISTYEAIMMLTYNSDHKIIEWREVCVEIDTT